MTVSSFQTRLGRFAYIETSSSGGSNLTPGTMALITSPVVTAEANCPVYMSFYYNMFGQDTGELQIQVRYDCLR